MAWQLRLIHSYDFRHLKDFYMRLSFGLAEFLTKRRTSALSTKILLILFNDKMYTLLNQIILWRLFPSSVEGVVVSITLSLSLSLSLSFSRNYFTSPNTNNRSIIVSALRRTFVRSSYLLKHYDKVTFVISLKLETAYYGR